MSDVIHHAFIVTGVDLPGLPYLDQAHAFAVGLGLPVTELTPPVVNCYRSFMVAPTGSKSGWDDDIQPAKARDQLQAYLWAQKEAGIPLDWVRVEYGNPQGEAQLLAASDDITPHAFKRQRNKRSEDHEPTK